MKTTIVLMMSVAVAPLVVHADGGTIRLREASGPFVVTVVTVPEPLRVGHIDTSVLVQDRETGRVILDATVNLAFHPVAGGSPRLFSRTTHGQAGNKLLQAAVVNIPTPGWWAIQVYVCRDREEAILSTKLLMMPAAPRWTTIWPFLIFPPFGIGLFVLHQRLRRPRLL